MPFQENLQERNIHTSEQMCKLLLEETGVAILPGSDFGRAPEELNARLAYVDFNGKAALQALDHIPTDRALDNEFLKKYCGNVIEAAERMCAWFAD